MRKIVTLSAAIAIVIIAAIAIGTIITKGLDKLIESAPTTSTRQTTSESMPPAPTAKPTETAIASPSPVPTVIITKAPTEPPATPKPRPTFTEPPTLDYNDILNNPAKYEGKKLTIWYYGQPGAGRGIAPGTDGKTVLNFFTGYDRAKNTWGVMSSEVYSEGKAVPYLLGASYILSGYLVDVDFNYFNDRIGTPPVLMITEWQELTMPIGFSQFEDPETYELTSGTLPDVSHLIPPDLKR
jgi:hypothetical protein